MAQTPGPSAAPAQPFIPRQASRGCGSLAETKPAFINYELKHFLSWLFTRASWLLLKNNKIVGFQSSFVAQVLISAAGASAGATSVWPESTER